MRLNDLGLGLGLGLMIGGGLGMIGSGLVRLRPEPSPLVAEAEPLTCPPCRCDPVERCDLYDDEPRGPHPTVVDDLEIELHEQRAIIDSLLAEPPIATVPFEPLDDAEREQMLATCDLRVEMPGKPKGPIDRVLTDVEREAYMQALAEVDDETRAGVEALLERYGVATPTALPGADEAEAARERVVRKRLGAEVDDAEPSAFEQWVELDTSAGDRLERRLGDRIGIERARELRRVNGGWPGGRVRYRGCPETE